MKKLIIVGITLLSAQLVLAQPAKIVEINDKFEFKNSKGELVEVTTENIQNKKYELKLRPESQLSSVVISSSYEIVLASSTEEIIFTTQQSRGKISGSDEAGAKQEALLYRGAAEKNGQKYDISCYEREKEIENSAKAEESKTIECIKRTSCNSYSTAEDGKSFVLMETPICIGKKALKIIPKKATARLNCMISIKDSKSNIKISQDLRTKESYDIKTQESCQ